MIKNEPIYKPAAIPAKRELAKEQKREAAAVAKNKNEHRWLYANKGKEVTGSESDSLLINRKAVVWARGTETGINAQYAGGAQ